MFCKDDKVIGIDFGTSSCQFGFFRDGQVEILKDEFGNDSMPSYVAFTDNRRLIGQEAKDQIAQNPLNTVFAVKRLLGKSIREVQAMKLDFSFMTVELENERCGIEVEWEKKIHRFYPEQIAAMLFSKMKRLSEQSLGVGVTGAVISVPPCFNSLQRQATVDAAKIAGFEKVKLIDDWIASAYSYSDCKMSDRCTSEHLLFLDLGGGFLSASFVAVGENSYNSISTHMVEFGGIDLDCTISKNLGANHFNIEKMEALRLSVELARLKLSPTNSELQVPHDGRSYTLSAARLTEIVTCEKFLEFGKYFKKVCEKLYEKERKVVPIILVGNLSLCPPVCKALRTILSNPTIFTESLVKGVILSASHHDRFRNLPSIKPTFNRILQFQGEKFLTEQSTRWSVENLKAKIKQIMNFPAIKIEEISSVGCFTIGSVEIKQILRHYSKFFSSSVTFSVNENMIVTSKPSGSYIHVLLYCLSIDNVEKFSTHENAFKWRDLPPIESVELPLEQSRMPGNTVPTRDQQTERVRMVSSQDPQSSNTTPVLPNLKGEKESKSELSSTKEAAESGDNIIHPKDYKLCQEAVDIVNMITEKNQRGEFSYG